MGLKFYFGASGAGKSTRVYQDMIEWSRREPEWHFFVIVPDQFTMQTQKDLVCMHPDRGIMNVEALSFGRLTHRILEEVGGEDIPVLDDTGKNLVLRRVAASLRERLKVLGKNLDRTGYIHEIKSVICELMQYGIGPEQLAQMADTAKGRGLLHAKLEDIRILYEAFRAYIQDRFITTEESLDILRRSLSRSKLIKDSVVAFDGFTGFTPVQLRVIQEMMMLCKQIWVTILIDTTEDAFKIDGEQKLFHLSKKTVVSLCKLQEQAGAARQEDVYLPGAPVMRHREHPFFDHLERNLFRYRKSEFLQETDACRIFRLDQPRDEAAFVCRMILKLVRTKGYAYRDIAVVTGDLPEYADLLAQEFSSHGIPYFIDQTSGIVLNPFVEGIRSALQVPIRDFSYESVFHYLRSGMTQICADDIDFLENYVRAAGIRGRRRYEDLFTKHTKEIGSDEDKLARLNAVREQVLQSLMPVLQPAKTMSERVKQLYELIVQAKIAEKLAAYEQQFTKEQKPAKAKEYAQIYRLVMELLEQMEALLGSEEVSQQEFYEILDAGLSEIRVGAIPQNVDRVVCGDMERTRLTEMKVLFFIGVNDGIIPRSGAGGGMISDMDREFLRGANWELSPTPRQKMYIQRLYLYMNLTKPDDHLFMTFAAMGADGKSRRHAYLIDTVRKMFPLLKVESRMRGQDVDEPETVEDALRTFVPMLRDYAAGLYEKDGKALERFRELYRMLSCEGSCADRVEKLLEAAFYTYRNTAIPKAVAEALYGTVLANSVSRMECFAGCEYRHFLEYGLRLEEREEPGVTDRDFGTICHEILSRFAEELGKQGADWLTFSKEQGKEILAGVIDALAAQFGGSALYSSARSEYMIRTLRSLMERSIETLQYQIRKGVFRPEGFEISFQTLEDIESVNVSLSDSEKIKLRGRIDRLDTYEDDRHVYVKVIDYKSGKKDFDLVTVYYGLTLQLVLYMNAALEKEKKRHPEKEIVPAGLLYYRMDDPIIDREAAMDEDAINREIRKALCMKGIVNADAGVIGMMDEEIASGGRSDVVPAQIRKDGTVSPLSHAYDRKALQTISDFVNEKIKEISRGILRGDISRNPYEYKDHNACEYCLYSEVCRYDESIRGCEKRKLGNPDEEWILEQMREDGNEIHRGSEKSN